MLVVLPCRCGRLRHLGLKKILTRIKCSKLWIKEKITWVPRLQSLEKGQNMLRLQPVKYDDSQIWHVKKSNDDGLHTGRVLKNCYIFKVRIFLFLLKMCFSIGPSLRLLINCCKLPLQPRFLSKFNWNLSKSIKIFGKSYEYQIILLVELCCKIREEGPKQMIKWLASFKILFCYSKNQEDLAETIPFLFMRIKKKWPKWVIKLVCFIQDQPCSFQS